MADPRVDDQADRWTNDVVLSDGTTVRVRPIAPTDGDGLVDFHERQSRESVYFRFFSPRPHLSSSEVAHLTTVDGVDRMAFVATRDDELVGVARYDRYGAAPVAEVAFFTDDRMGGRGIATLLLEYLAAHAREVGITRFEAHVLPANQRMTRVFRAAGFRTSAEFADGVVEVTLDIEPTEEAAHAMAERAARAERQSVVRLLEPRCVAVVGAGRAPDGIGHRVLRNLLDGGFHGPVHPVHPEASSVAGVRAWPTIGDVPDDVDVAVVCVPAPEVADVVAACGRARVRAVVVISAGFAEAGPEGAEEQARVLDTARRYGIRVLGPNCLGVVNTDPAVSMHATFAEIDVLPGRTGLLSQSGTLGGVILDQAHRVGLGISSFVAVGNKADLSGNDLLLYWLDDDRTDVVLLYLESFGNPRRFGRNVRRVAARMPVFAVRAGAVLDLDADPDVDRDGWLDDATVDALLRQTGVVRVPTVRALLDAGLVASTQPVPRGPRVAVVGNSGGSGAMAADACLHAGLELARLGEATGEVVDRHRLRSRPVPVDLPFDASPEAYLEVLGAVAVDPGVDAVLVAHAPQRPGEDRMPEVLDRIAAEHPDVPLVACLYGEHPPVTDGGVPLFDFPDDAALALARYVRHGLWLAQETRGEVLAAPDPDAVDGVVQALLAERGPGALDPATARRVLALGGVSPVPVIALDGPAALASVLAAAGAGGRDGATAPADGSVAEVLAAGRLALKADRHESGALTQSSGVALDLPDVDAVAEAAAAIEAGMGDDAWPMVLQPMVDPGVDVRVAIRTHPVVGPVVQVGPGGGAGRYLDSTRRVLPVTDLAVDELVVDAGLHELLDDAGLGHLRQLVRSLCAIVDAAPAIVELVCDPVIVSSTGAAVVELRVALAPERPPAPDVRRL